MKKLSKHAYTIIGKTAKKAYRNDHFPKACHQVCPLETKLLPNGHMKEVPK